MAGARTRWMRRCRASASAGSRRSCSGSWAPAGSRRPWRSCCSPSWGPP
uniref:Uncharacterized protein n=1 Tax=Arundo donax TaxID=35708 RepID=A0A0A8XNB0_ARUDO